MIFLQLQQFLVAALDTTVTEQTVDHELLEADANGYKPTDTQKFEYPSCYDMIIMNHLEVSLSVHYTVSRAQIQTFIRKYCRLYIE